MSYTFVVMLKQKQNFFLIYLAVFVSALASTMIFPLLPSYAEHFHASNFFIGMLAASFALAQLLSSPFWGILSDRLGRKKIILFGLAGLAFSFLVFAVTGNIVTLFLSRFIQGIFSGAIMPSARAYIADLTSKENRVKAMGRIGAALGTGVILGPALGGILSESQLALPFLIAALLAIANFIFVFLLMPESPKEKMSSGHIGIHLVFVSFKHLAKGMKGDLAPLFFLSFLWSFAVSNNQVNIPLLGTNSFSLSASHIGLGFTFMGIVSAVTQFLFITKISLQFGQKKTALAGLVIMGFSIITMPFLPHSAWFLYLAMACAGLGSALARPIITAMLSEETKEGQGITMGTANSFESLGRLVGPLLGGTLFGLSMTLPFVALGATTALCALLIAPRLQHVPNTKS